MTNVFLYVEGKILEETIDSKTQTFDDFLKLLVDKAGNAERVDIRIEECFDGKNTYFNVMFVPNILRMKK